MLQNNVVLVGHSQGGVFLAKYPAENRFPKRIKATFLIAAPFDDKDSDYTLLDFSLPKSLAKLVKQGGEIFVWQSKDDPVVPFVDLAKYAKVLPSAHIFAINKSGRGFLIGRFFHAIYLFLGGILKYTTCGFDAHFRKHPGF